jgi:signal recognition particle receptor subunit beta
MTTNPPTVATTRAVVAVNESDRGGWLRLDDVRAGLAIDATVPVLACAARNRESVRQVLTTLASDALGWRTSRGHMDSPTSRDPGGSE